MGKSETQTGGDLLLVRCGINDFNGDVKVLLDSVVFCKFNSELSILHQISIDRCRRLKVTKPCGLFECSLVDLIIIDRASHNSKAHIKRIEFETFSESSRCRCMHCCNNRFLFQYVRAAELSKFIHEGKTKYNLHSHCTVGNNNSIDFSHAFFDRLTLPLGMAKDDQSGRCPISLQS